MHLKSYPKHWLQALDLLVTGFTLHWGCLLRSSSSYTPFSLVFLTTHSLILDSNVLRRTEFPLSPGRPRCEISTPLRDLKSHASSTSAAERIVTEQVSVTAGRGRAWRSLTAGRSSHRSSLTWRHTAWSDAAWRRLAWLTHRSWLSAHWRLAHWSWLALGAWRLSHRSGSTHVRVAHWSWLLASHIWVVHWHAGSGARRVVSTHPKLDTSSSVIS